MILPGSTDGGPEVAPRVLIVDDEARWCERLASLLLPLGCQVECTWNGWDALSKLRTQPFDLMILDLMMPYQDGMEVLKALRQDPQFQSLPVLMLRVQLAAVEDDQRLDTLLRELGADVCLAKSGRLKDAEILAAVRRLLAADGE